jgi:Cu/Ag efflux protein CusF
MMKLSLTPLAGLLVAATVAAQVPATQGEVTKIDRANARLTLKHGEIKHLDMPPMTMVFRVKDAKSIEGLNPGDRVRFTAEKVDGQFTVTSISKAP